jgi:hypothetical protein
MTARHGTRRRYNEGCRCEDCTAANAAYQQSYRQRATTVRLSTWTTPLPEQMTPAVVGPVESGVQLEIEELTDARPGLVQVALAMARLLDNPKAVNQQPAAAKVLSGLLDKLATASAGGRCGRLSVIKSMTEKGGALWLTFGRWPSGVRVARSAPRRRRSAAIARRAALPVVVVTRAALPVVAVTRAALPVVAVAAAAPVPLVVRVTVAVEVVVATAPVPVVTPAGIPPFTGAPVISRRRSDGLGLRDCRHHQTRESQTAGQYQR